MKKNQDTKERLCAFYASDYHFEMMSLPYISKKIDEKDEVIILTENNLEKTIQTFLTKINLKEEKKRQILKLNWKNSQEEKLEEVRKKLQEQKNMIIFVKGKEEYIQKTNLKIEECLEEKNGIKIIDCYNIEEVGNNLNKIMEQYSKILKTTGEKEITKI